MILRSCLQSLFAGAALALTLFSSGCANNQTAAYLTARHLVGLDRPADDVPLNPTYRYLRVTIGSTAALMVLGEVDHDGSPYPTEVWYSADRRVLKLQNGRLVGLLGLPVEWRSVTYPGIPTPPAWPTTGISGTLEYRRTVDRMPAYDIGRVTPVSVHRIPPPTNTALRQLAATELIWFEETAPDGSPARFAFAMEGSTIVRPVYGEQCVSVDLCLRWQRWPAH